MHVSNFKTNDSKELRIVIVKTNFALIFNLYFHKLFDKIPKTRDVETTKTWQKGPPQSRWVFSVSSFIKMFMFLIWNRLKESERRKVIHKKKLEGIKRPK